MIRFPWLKPRAIFDNRCAKKNIACGFNRRNTMNFLNDYVISKYRFEIRNDTFSMIKTTGYIENHNVRKT